jgi:DNA-binding NtrC family response regulator
VIERAILLSRGNTIDKLDIRVDPNAVLPEGLDLGLARAAEANGHSSHPSIYTSSTESIQLDPKLSGDALFEEIGKLVVDSLEEPEDGAMQNDVFSGIESGVVLAALKRTRGNKQAAANLLGLYRPRLYGMIKRHNLEERV